MKCRNTTVSQGSCGNNALRNTTCTTWLSSSVLLSQPLTQSPSLFFFLSFPTCKDPQRFRPLLHYLLTSPPTRMTFSHSEHYLSENDTPIFPVAIILLPTDMPRVPRIQDIQNQSIFLPKLLFLLQSASWLKMSSPSLAGKLRVTFYFYFSLTSYIKQVARFCFSAKSLFLSLSFSHRQCLSVNPYHLFSGLFLKPNQPLHLHPFHFPSEI